MNMQIQHTSKKVATHLMVITIVASLGRLAGAGGASLHNEV
jgi:hypothetical protein